MQGKLIDGKKIADKIHRRTKRLVLLLKKQGINPKLAVVLVGDHRPSEIYVNKKGQAAQKVGIAFKLYRLPGTITKEKLVKKIITIQRDKDLSGLIVQLPLPENLYAPDVLNAIKAEKDVDCLTNENMGRIVMKTNTILPPTPGAMVTICEELGIDLKGKNITVVGAGALVGKPLAIILMNKRATVTVCNSISKNFNKDCLNADIIMTGVGEHNLIRGKMVKKDALVIDAGINFFNGKVGGDINQPEIQKKAAHYTPTPGGVGPITVAILLWNTALCAKLFNQPKK